MLFSHRNLITEEVKFSSFFLFYKNSDDLTAIRALVGFHEVLLIIFQLKVPSLDVTQLMTSFYIDKRSIGGDPVKQTGLGSAVDAVAVVFLISSVLNTIMFDSSAA